MHFCSADEIADLLKIYNISLKDLEGECSTEHMGPIANIISWKVVGPHLRKMSVEDIELILKDKFILNKKAHFLDLWMERNGYHATYLALIIGMLKKMKQKEAETVCKLLEECKCYTNGTIIIIYLLPFYTCSSQFYIYGHHLSSISW